MMIAGRNYTVERPHIADPRFHLAAVISTLHVLGQTKLHFDESIAQILIAVGSAAVFGFVIGAWRDQIIAWPASAVLAGNGIAFVLRVPGTLHGDWWSTRGWWIYVVAVAIALGSKMLVRVRGSHVFNPANIALVVVLLGFGSKRVDPLDLWWGPASVPVTLALTVIGIGGVAILLRLQIVSIAVSFWVTFATAAGVLTAAGHFMTARWHLGPVCGRDLWWTLVSSPEILVFMFFMITDPKTSPSGRLARVIYGSAIGGIACLLIATQTTEFGTKVSVLATLAIVCAIRPFVEHRLPSPASAADHLGSLLRGRRTIFAVSFTCVALALVVLTKTIQGNIDHPAIAQARSVNRQLPPITVDNSGRVAATITLQVARTITSDVIDDFSAIELAQKSPESGLESKQLERAAAETWLRHLRSDRAAAQRRGTRRSDHIVIERAAIALARRPGQGAPAILITVHGLQSQTTTSLSRHTSHSTTNAPFAHTWEVKYLDNHFVLVTDELPPGYEPAP